MHIVLITIQSGRQLHQAINYYFALTPSVLLVGKTFATANYIFLIQIYTLFSFYWEKLLNTNERPIVRPPTLTVTK